MGFSEYIIYIFNFSLGATAVLAFFVIIASGIKIAESQGDSSKIQKAKQNIINSLIGLTIILTSYILLTTINPGIINIENISLGTTGIKIPIINPNKGEEDTKNYQFEEIPIGTLTESILAGTSSLANKVPCYEYEHSDYDKDGNIIVGNTIDKNKDGKIDENDALLDRDMFYCIKLLDDAIKKKIEVHLNVLIHELDQLLKGNCFCSKSFSSFLPPHTVPGEVFQGEGECPTPYGVSYCSCCGNAKEGCTSALDNTYTVVTTESNSREFRQYKYDTCDNRLAIYCKQQQIKELMDGTKPDHLCYEETKNGSPLIAKEQPFNFFTIKEGIKRLNDFKIYYDNQVKALENAELKMKDPYGERLTLSEINNYVDQTTESVTVSKQVFTSDPNVYYNPLRYCRLANCTDPSTSTEASTCSKYQLNDKQRVCKMELTESNASCKGATGASEALLCKEYYSYNGDPANFYFSSEYNADEKDENTVMDKLDNVCTILDQNMDEEKYGGLIRIGETVDYTEDWGKEVSKRINKIKEEVEGMLKTGLSVASLPDKCGADNCTNQDKDRINVCVDPMCNCKGDCCPPTVYTTSCKDCEPKETICNVLETENMNEVGSASTCSKKQKKPYGGCSSCCGGGLSLVGLSCPKVDTPQSEYWTCPYRSFCMLMKDMYQRRPVERSCFEEVKDTTDDMTKEQKEEIKTEDQSRLIKRSKVGYVQKMEEREAMLFDLAQVGEIKDAKEKDYQNSIKTVDLIKGDDAVCPSYLANAEGGLACNEKLNKDLGLWKRFDLFDMLKTSRERLEGCVTGFSYPYKKADIVRVMSCYEISNSTLNISPRIEMSNNTPPYIDCYPYNSNKLTAKEKEKCFYNINRMGDESDPGCFMITKNYMDNYYCCQ